MLSVQLVGKESLKMELDKKDDATQNDVLSLEKIKERDEKIHKAYLNFIELGDEHYFVELMEMVDSMSKYRVAEKMKAKMNYYDSEYMEDLMQECRLQMWKDLKNAREMGVDQQREHYGYLARTIYERAAGKVLKGDFDTQKRKANFNTDSEEVRKENGKEQEAGLDSSPVQSVFDKEAAGFYVMYLEEFMRTLMDTEEAPQDCLAVVYTRLLPHIMGYVADNITSSVKWARQRMGTHDVEYLSGESELEIAGCGYSFFRWGKHYVKQLDNVVEINGKRYILRKVIYLEAFDYGKNIENMDRRAFRTILNEATKKLSQNSKFVALASEYLDKDERLYKLIGGVKR